MKRICTFLIFSVLLFAQTYSQTYRNDTIVPLSKVFYRFGHNTLHSLSYNKGLNLGLSIASTYALVKSGADWEWNRMAYNNSSIANAGMPSVAIGGLVPIVLPLGIYIYGRHNYNVKLQITGLALGQAAIISLGLTSCIKAITGRKPPGILGNEKDPSKEDYSGNFAFGLLERGIFNGWPSGHTTTAFAMAFTLMKLYPENPYIKYGSLSYALLVGTGVSVNIHWLSDFTSGVLIGYAIGSVVGNEFVQLINNKESNQQISYILEPNKLGICYNF